MSDWQCIVDESNNSGRAHPAPSYRKFRILVCQCQCQYTYRISRSQYFVIGIQNSKEGGLAGGLGVLIPRSVGWVNPETLYERERSTVKLS